MFTGLRSSLASWDRPSFLMLSLTKKIRSGFELVMALNHLAAVSYLLGKHQLRRKFGPIKAKVAIFFWTHNMGLDTTHIPPQTDCDSVGAVPE